MALAAKVDICQPKSVSCFVQGRSCFVVLKSSSRAAIVVLSEWCTRFSKAENWKLTLKGTDGWYLVAARLCRTSCLISQRHWFLSRRSVRWIWWIQIFVVHSSNGTLFSGSPTTVQHHYTLAIGIDEICTIRTSWILVIHLLVEYAMKSKPHNFTFVRRSDFTSQHGWLRSHCFW